MMMPSTRGVSLGFCVALAIPSSVNSIIGGTPSPDGAWGSYVRILITGGESCGGTAIQDNLVLTAAHCVYKSGREDCPDGDTAWGNNPVWSGHCAADPSEIWIAKNNVRFNASAKNEAVPDYNFPAVLEGSEFVQGGVLDYIVHPDYQDGSVDWPSRGNDLAIIILDSSSPMPGPYVKLARSPPKAEAKGTIVGMGANNYYRQWVEGQSRTYFPPRLYQVDVTVGKPGVAPCVDGPRHMHPGRAPASLFIARATNVTATYNEAYMEFGGSNVLCPNLPDVLGASMDPELELCLVGDWFYDDQLQYPDSPNPMQRTGLGLKSSCQGDSGGPLYVGDTQHGITERGPNGNFCQLYSMSYFSVYTRVDAHMDDFIDPIVADHPPVTEKGGPTFPGRGLGALLIGLAAANATI